jgi:ornithine cyclodeaminase/alanine dehydrogenase-like protein (mu-crystallin family)
VMPSALAGPFGVKLVTVRSAAPRIQGVYVLFDSTGAPALLIDGVALTAVRTAAVSALAVRLLARGDASSLLVYGRGVQGRAHVDAIRAVVPSIEDVAIVGRDDAAGADVERADIICCCTTAREPLFDGTRVTDGAVVVAVGSHEPEAREVDSTLVRRAAAVVVESRSAALREAGDVIQAGLGEDDLITLGELVNGAAPAAAGPRVFKSVGMSWEDAVLAAALA